MCFWLDASGKSRGLLQHVLRFGSLLLLLLCTLRESILADGTRYRLVCFGDSITAGYGLDPSQAYPALLQKLVDAEHLPFTVVNAGLSGDTTAGGLRRIDWTLKQPVDVFLLALGGNDGLRGLSVSMTRSNLVGILQKVRTQYPKAVLILAGMQMPENMGSEYTTAFRNVFSEVAKQTGSKSIPFLLEGVGGKPEWNQEDKIHPTAAGHEIVAQNVWAVLKPVLQSFPTGDRTSK